MQYDLVADTTKLCRVCMTADLNEGTSLESSQPSLHEMLKAICAPVFDKTEEGHPPGMPTKVCAICRNAILAAFKLHQTCIANDQRLRELLALKWELQDLEDDDSTLDPLGFNSREALQNEILNMSVDDGGQAEEQSNACEESLEKTDDSLTDCEFDDAIKVEELDIMDGSDNDHGNDPDSDKNEEAVVEEDSTTCRICSKSFGKSASLKLHMTLKHRHLMKHQEKGKEYACNFCEKTFRAGFFLRKHKAAVHRNVKDSNQPFTCPLCEEAFATALELLTHKKTHETPVECSCGRRFINARRLKIHLASKTCSGESNKKCEICNKVFKTNDVMLRHRNLVHSDPVDCPMCGQTMRNADSLRVHLRTGYCSVQSTTEAVIAARTCKVCGEEQRSHYAVRSHMIRAHPDRMFRCDMCNMEFLTKKYLDLHKKTHDLAHDTKTYQCKTCSEFFPTKKALIQHRRKHRDPFKCSVCGKMLSSKHSLASHMERHVGLKPFSCDVCPMRFITKVEIKGHMLTHTKKQDHVCDVCGSRFTTNHSLKKHKRIVHEGQRPHSCSLCGLKFDSSNRLKRHMYTHTGEKPHKCELCPQAYAQTNDLVKHVARAHGNGNPYLCDRCDEEFRLLTDLRQHYRVHVQSTERAVDQLEEVRFTSVAILKRAFAKAKQRQEIESVSK